MAAPSYPDYEYDENEDDADYYEEYDYNNLMDEDIEWVDEENGDIAEDLTFSEVVEYCVNPTLSSTLPHLSLLLGWVIVFTLATRIVRIPPFAINLLSAVSGGCVLSQVFGWKTLYLVGQIIAGWISLSLTSIFTGFGPWPVCCLCLLYLLVCELWLVDATQWHSIRGAQMIILMKIVSYVHDEIPLLRKISSKNSKVLTETSGEQRIEYNDGKSNKKNKNQIETKTELESENQENSSNNFKNYLLRSAEFVGYLLHPGTVIFGPWCSIGSYRGIFLPMNWTISWVVRICINFAMSLFCLLSSTCFVAWLVSSNSNRWLVAYRDAASFRLSHYFVSHLSEASASLGGLDVGVVARAQHIEFPRSLLSVVTFWNIPMHTFLKKYVFVRVRASVGVWWAVFVTYSASAVIHGLNGQLCAVLLSLAVYTHAEHVFRTKLATAFDACVLAKACGKTCDKHGNKAHSGTSLVINGLLGVVCAWHLAYLGVMFDSTPESETGYSILHTISKWNNLQFASHWVVLSTYVITALI